MLRELPLKYLLWLDIHNGLAHFIPSVFFFTPMVLMENSGFLPLQWIIPSLSCNFISFMFWNLINIWWDFFFKDWLCLSLRESLQFEVSSLSLVMGNVGLLFLQIVPLFHSLCCLLLMDSFSLSTLLVSHLFFHPFHFYLIDYILLAHEHTLDLPSFCVTHRILNAKYCGCYLQNFKFDFLCKKLICRLLLWVFYIC